MTGSIDVIPEAYIIIALCVMVVEGYNEMVKYGVPYNEYMTRPERII